MLLLLTFFAHAAIVTFVVEAAIVRFTLALSQVTARTSEGPKEPA